MNKQDFRALRPYLLLWSTQSLSTLGSGMTSYALVLWLYLRTGSALWTALLTVCSYAPYVMMSIFAGALSDRWSKKRTMLTCDALAACCTLAVLALLKTGRLAPWHLYALNAVSGLMNTVQQPAGEVTATLLVPRRFYQKTSGLRSLSQALNSILTPVLATAVFSLAGMNAVIAVDLLTFTLAFLTLWIAVPIPEALVPKEKREGVLASARGGLQWLRRSPLILALILFLANINLIASIYNAALPAMVLPQAGARTLGLVNGCAGVATLCGSLLMTLLPPPRDRVRTICLALFFAMSTENFILAFCRTTPLWCFGALLGWLMIPVMNANLDVIFRSTIPPNIQGRVYACRNTLQFFTIPAGYLLGGALVDHVFEPLMAAQRTDSLLGRFFGAGKGSGAAMLFAVIGVAGVLVCLVFYLHLRRYHWREEKPTF